jgi:hypothetical protein
VAKTLKQQNKYGETVLGWVLKLAASGLISEPRTEALVMKLLSLGADARIPAFQEQVRIVRIV